MSFRRRSAGLFAGLAIAGSRCDMDGDSANGGVGGDEADAARTQRWR